ncbi:MAG: DUF2169 domain-containing protein, partial [Anaerolineales bacterium]
MEIYNLDEQFLTLGWIVGKWKPPQLAATFFIKGTFNLKPDSIAEPVEDEPEMVSGDLYCDDDMQGSIYYESDFAPFKPRADLLLTGKCHVPGGRSVSACRVTFQVSSHMKSLAVFGNRKWSGVLPTITTPEPFSEMELRYEKCFGGEKYNRNPLGKGYWKERTDEGDAIWPLPNIEDPNNLIRTQKNDPGPAGFGPLGKFWKERSAKLGSYKGKWAEERWPWFPSDFDWSFFNAAPPDMQVPGYLKGDEKLYFENLHPDLPKYRSELPGLRAKCFISETCEDNEENLGFREVPLNLDTLWIDMEAERLVLVWRGSVNIRTFKFKELKEVFLLAESLSEPVHDLPYYREMKEECVPVEEELDFEEKSELAKRIEIEVAELKQEAAKVDQEFAELDAAAAQIETDHMARAVKHGFDPKLIENPPQYGNPKVVLLPQIAELSKEYPKIAAGAEQALSELDSVDNEIEIMDKEEKQFDEAYPDKPALTRDLVIAGATDNDSFHDVDLSGLDLSGLNLKNLDFSDSYLSGCSLSGSNLSGANLAGANLSGVDLSHADLTGAILDEVIFREAIFSHTKLKGTSINGTDFSKLDLKNVDFSECKG